ncbi:MAG: I78 family peptidase inhibitor [Burkholderiaceae bacterium]
MTLRLPVTLAVALALAGCAGQPFAQAPAPGTVASSPAPAPAPAPVPAGECNAAPGQYAVGQMAATALEEELRVRTGSQTVRVLRPGQMVTMEFNGRRLNLDVDATGRILRVRCG